MLPTAPEHGPAETFFADVLLALKHAQSRRRQHYFALAPDAAVASYWAEPVSRHGGVHCCTLAEADGAAMIVALAEHWLAQGDADLASLAEELESLRQALTQVAPAAAERPAAPSYSAYPLF